MSVAWIPRHQQQLFWRDENGPVNNRHRFKNFNYRVNVPASNATGVKQPSGVISCRTFVHVP